MERLQKYLARCGVASRRASEQLITSGQVKVNGIVVTELGTKIGIGDTVTYKGKEVLPQEHIYVLMNKPRFIVCTANDEHNRKTVIDILPEELMPYRLFPVGRLDYDTKGALLLTNDGELMNMLVGPKSNCEKEYLARVKGVVSDKELKRLSIGVKVDDYVTRPCTVLLEDIDKVHDSCLLRFIITEGKYHQVKNMCAAVGHEVKNLTRVRFANLTVDGLKEGEVRFLTTHEIKQLYGLGKAKLH